jgi:hypothetical protein
MTFEETEGLESATESSESTESQSEGAESSPSTEAPAQAAAPKQDETPFHEHPRFKELVEQKNAAINSTRALELKLAQLEGRLSQPQTAAKQAERDELIEDLKKIDPRLASRLEAFGKYGQSVEQIQKQFDEFKQSQAQQSQQQVVQQSVAKINSWHDSNKVPDAIKSAINAQLDVQYMQGKLNPQNLEQAYKAAYEPYKAFIEQTQREALKSYVPAKKADANTPTSQPKGTPASKPAKAPEKQFKDREELRAHVAKEYAKQMAAKREASSV